MRQEGGRKDANRRRYLSTLLVRPAPHTQGDGPGGRSSLPHLGPYSGPLPTQGISPTGPCWISHSA